jgi:tetratricopeptide (TPR) repeat protein
VIFGTILLVGVLGSAYWYWSHHDSDPTHIDAAEQADASPRPIPVRAESELPYHPNQFNLTTDQSIQVFEHRVRDDPQSHLDLTTLAGIYIRKAREDGDLAAYDQAESALRRAVQLVPNHLPARVGLAITASARHQFAAAAELAQAVLREAPNDPEALTVLGDAQLELGRYPEAERAFHELEQNGPPPAALIARFARLAELRGDLDSAVRLLSQALASQREDHDFRQASAWYSMRLGEICFNRGQFDEAARHLETALADNGRSTATLGLFARVREAQGRTDDAIALFERALLLHPDLAMLGDLSDLYAKNGNDFRAKLLADSIDQVARGKPEYDRELALFYCNHNRALPKALELARRDYHLRQDIFASDTLAWALVKNGQGEEASKSIAEALRLGTRDATLYYHAGVIYDQIGKPEKAREFLSRALALNPQFSITQADEARRLLSRLDETLPPR